MLKGYSSEMFHYFHLLDCPIDPIYFPRIVLESIKDRPELQKVHLGLPKEELEDQMKRQIEE